MDRPCYHPGMRRDPLRLDQFLCFAIYSANGAFNRAYKPMLERLGLTYPQYVAMVALWESDGVTVGEVGRRMHLETNTLTPLLKRLEAMGLVRRRRDAADERQVRVHLTDDGRRLRDAAEPVPAAVAEALRSVAAPDDVARLQGEVARLRDALNERMAKAG